MVIRISSWIPKSVALGPGERSVLFVQGCNLGCTGCFSPKTHDFDVGRSVSVTELAERIASVSDIEGLTISGGEPMLQAKPLAELSFLLKEQGLTVMSYSGFTLSELQASVLPGVPQFLNLLDILIDGRFEVNQQANLTWRGSTNQRIHYLSDAYQPSEEEAAHVELLIGSASVTATGVWPRAFPQRFRRALDAQND